MFGYHHSGACSYDLWAPGVRTDVENRAFSPYCKHTTEVEQIITILVDNARMGNMNVTIETDEFLSESDWKYIQEEVQKRF